MRVYVENPSKSKHSSDLRVHINILKVLEAPLQYTLSITLSSLVILDYSVGLGDNVK